MAKKIALVLSGGGARGAYETGVLKYIIENIYDKKKVWFNLFCGTSIGALNSSYLAARVEDPAQSVNGLLNYWKSIAINRILYFGARELLNLFRLSKSSSFLDSILFNPKDYPGGKSFRNGIFNTEHLYRDLNAAIPWNNIKISIEKGNLAGIALCAIELCTGKSIVFYQQEKNAPLYLGHDSLKEALPVEISIQHAMASAAIPFVYPSVQINDICYADGALMQNTPIDPAIKMGAEKLLIINLSQSPGEDQTRSWRTCRNTREKGFVFVLNKITNLLLSETLDYDIHHIKMFNNLIEDIRETFGEDGIEKLDQVSLSYRKVKYRPIETCLVRPSVDLNEIARVAVKEKPEEINFSGIYGRIFKKIFLSRTIVDSDILSYFLFTPRFISLVTELGYEDARKKRHELQEFFEAGA